MRGAERQTSAMFSYLSPERLVPPTHPLRVVRPLVDAALERLSGDFNKIYSRFGRNLMSICLCECTPTLSAALNALC